MENHWLTKQQTRKFLAVIAQYFDVVETSRHGVDIVWHDGEQPDFAFLYARYPKVKIRIEQAIQKIVLMRTQCHA
jgi:hypothetical protein